MDNQVSAQSEETSPDQASPVSSIGLPPIKTLFADSWHVFTKSLLRLFVILVSNIFVSLFLFSLFAVLVILLIGIGPLQNAFAGKQGALQQLLSTQSLTMLGLLFACYLLLSIIASIFILAAEILAIDRYNEPFSLGFVISHVRKVFFPLIIGNCLIGFLVAGSYVVFIIPGLLISFFLLFASYEVILKEQRPLTALKRSAFIVTKNFGGIFVRILLLWIIIFVINFAPNIAGAVDDSLELIFGIISFLISFFVGWYALVYTLTLYKQARVGLDNEKGSSIGWMWIVAIIGWFIIGGLVYGGYKAVSSQQFKDMVAVMMATKDAQEEPELTYVPSSCGVEVVLPSTTDTYKDQKRQWISDEVFIEGGPFRNLNPQVFSSQEVEATVILYRDTAERILDGEIFPGIEIMCIDNIRKLTLDTYKGLILENHNLQIEADRKPLITDGGVTLQFMEIAGENAQGKSFKDPTYIGISKDGIKLLYIRLWAAEKNDPKVKTIEDDQVTLLESLRYGPTGDLPAPTVMKKLQTTTQQRYIAPTIKPGAPGSKEWQEDFDRKWNEMGQKNADMQQKVEQNQAEFCRNNPSMCN